MNLTDSRYVNLATYRKSGAQVATPVWAAHDDGSFYVFSAGDAGKVKRLRNSDRAALASCDYAGKLLGEWQDARATLFDDPAKVEQALRLLRKKYGWQMHLADLGARLTGRYGKRAFIEVTLQ